MASESEEKVLEGLMGPKDRLIHRFLTRGMVDLDDAREIWGDVEPQQCLWMAVSRIRAGLEGTGLGVVWKDNCYRIVSDDGLGLRRRGRPSKT